MNYIIIVAGGSGTRMKSAVPKQFLLLKNKPVLAHTLEAFYQSNIALEIILALPKDWITEWDSLCRKYNIAVPHKIIAGGSTRYESVKNALAVVDNYTGYVGVHDGVRPIVSNELIERCYNIAFEKGNAIPCINLKDSIRKVFPDAHSEVRNRSDYKLVQTPQVFKSSILKAAYKQDYKESFTDDASIVESAGNNINLIPGDSKNIKITEPDDLKIAELYL